VDTILIMGIFAPTQSSNSGASRASLLALPGFGVTEQVQILPPWDVPTTEIG
jgi:hypothetical protein